MSGDMEAPTSSPGAWSVSQTDPGSLASVFSSGQSGISDFLMVGTLESPVSMRIPCTESFSFHCGLKATFQTAPSLPVGSFGLVELFLSIPLVNMWLEFLENWAMRVEELVASLGFFIFFYLYP
jgi:hypothetical protein